MDKGIPLRDGPSPTVEPKVSPLRASVPDALLRCPFCDGAGSFEGPEFNATGWHIACDDCGAMGPQFSNWSDVNRSKVDAIEAWNKRGAL